VRGKFFRHVGVRILDEESALTDSGDSTRPSWRVKPLVHPKDGDVMINDAGKHEVKGEVLVATRFSRGGKTDALEVAANR